MKPTVGRIVHYTNLGDKDGRYPPEQQAAMITKVKFVPLLSSESPPSDPEREESYEVSLHIFYPTGQFDMQAVPFSESYERGRWTWPPRA